MNPLSMNLMLVPKMKILLCIQRGPEKSLGGIKNPAGAPTTLISDKSRVFKGASWKDRAYYLNPGTRRFLEEDRSLSTIGFRCAMDRIGSPTGIGVFK